MVNVARSFWTVLNQICYKEFYNIEVKVRTASLWFWDHVTSSLISLSLRGHNNKTGLPWSMPNADQCRSKLWHWSQCRSIPINAMILIGIDPRSPDKNRQQRVQSVNHVYKWWWWTSETFESPDHILWIDGSPQIIEWLYCKIFLRDQSCAASILLLLSTVAPPRMDIISLLLGPRHSHTRTSSGFIARFFPVCFDF